MTTQAVRPGGAGQAGARRATTSTAPLLIPSQGGAAAVAENTPSPVPAVPAAPVETPPSRSAGRARTRWSGARLVPLAGFGVDLLVTVLGVSLAVVGRESMSSGAGLGIATTLVVAGPLMVAGWLAALALFGAYGSKVFGAGTDEYKRIVSGSFLTFGAIGVTAYMVQLELSRGFFLLAAAVGIPGLLLGRLGLRLGLQRAHRSGRLRHRVLIAGTEGHVAEIADVLRRETWLGYEVVGAVTPTGRARPGTGLDVPVLGVPVLGCPNATAAVAADLGADVVLLAGGAFDSAAELRRLAWDLETKDVQVVVAPSVTDVAAERVSIRPVGGLPLVHLEKPRAAEATRLAKRLFDVVGSAALLLAFSPVFLVAAIAVWRDDRGPVFFRQVRVGRNGAPFGVWKFRTMVVDAEERLAALHAQAGYEGGLFKLTDDPRVTAPGTWLRRYSVDELPQLLNVLRGDMSLVGPRPPLEDEVAQYDSDMARRLRVRPGMTGLWQVSGRSELSWSEAIRLDLYYVDNWSMLQDLTILARTFTAVLAARGAY